MFRNRFNDVFPKSLAHFGPQELERDVVEQAPGDRVEHLLCALLGLILNRKQDVKYATTAPAMNNGRLTVNRHRPGHYGRALEDSISSHRSQWAPEWDDKSPLSGGTTFNTMNPTERVRPLAATDRVLY